MTDTPSAAQPSGQHEPSAQPKDSPPPSSPPPSGPPAGAPTSPAGPPTAVAPPPGAHPYGGHPQGPYPPGAYAPYQAWAPHRKPPPSKLRPPAPARPTSPTLWAILATALAAALLLSGGAGANLLLVAVPATAAGALAARAAGRRLRPWTLVWALGGAVLLVVPVLSDAGWPTFLAVVTALGLTGYALHGGRGWPSMLFGPVGLFDSVGSGMPWTWQGMRHSAGGAQGRFGALARPILIALGLLVVFGALFAGADAAFADLLGGLMPDISLDQAPWRLLCFLLGLFGAIAVARTAAAPLRWDRLTFSPGRPRARLEWALPLVVLCLLFAAFNAVQLAVLFGGYDKVLSETGLTYSEYARQGFWQLLFATLLTLAVIGLALRWAPRGTPGDTRLVRSVLGTLCVLTLVVVASALRRMELYVDAYGLTRLRISVSAMEIWLGVAILLIMAAGIWGAKLLPRALAASAAGFVLAFGLIQPDAVIAEQNVQRYQRDHKIDVNYLAGLSADAAPALDRLPERLRDCALGELDDRFDRTEGEPWFATSRSEARARDILERRPATNSVFCGEPSRDEEYDPDADPYAPDTDPYAP
ncbi:DUF4173 domain-containing protein [Streptomyces sp. SKN60]|uniref:DUF4153 domain-containing protein n=1 Tax=Streptomyces sp. SKN60 TaxID=2855506 RepID=UPI00224515F8|nr:DUF4153 domain-containing protein [Streptomyces sp. SKN60]MCX2181868.1 DUF4173 domain-containing protein [Streptomyces sp. SKN60]